MPYQNEKINVFGRTNFRNRQVPFGIKPDDRRRHMYVIGKTGMGKTTLMENMVIQDIRNGHGVCFIDPHGDSVAKILDFIPPNRINDVVYFNPADLDHPIAFNILESVESRYKHLVASGLMGVFTKIWADQWSSRMAYILNNTLLAMLDSPGNTMLGVLRMYVDKKYRKRIVDNVKDPMVKSFWIEEFANYNERYRTEAVAPIQNKVGQFLSSGVIRNIIGQSSSTLDLRDIMDNKKILLLDLSKGKVGEDNSALLGAMIITKLQLAALSRVDIPEEDRQDFYLYVDEFQNFVTDSFATILSEARKYRLNLIIGHQYIGQLTPDNNTKVRDAVFGNVGTMVVFRVGAADAEFLETEFEPSFTPTDIVNLPKYHIILKLMINGVASDPFTAGTLQAKEDWRIGESQKVIKVSRERYSRPREQVEEKIGRWMGSDFHEASAHSASGEPEKSDNYVKPPSKPTYQSKSRPNNNQSRSGSNKDTKNATKNVTSPQNSSLTNQDLPAVKEVKDSNIKISTEFLSRVKAKDSKTDTQSFNKPKADQKSDKFQNRDRPTQPKSKSNKPKANLNSKPKSSKRNRSPKNDSSDIWSVAQNLQDSNAQNQAGKNAGTIAEILDKNLKTSNPNNKPEIKEKTAAPLKQESKAESTKETVKPNSNISAGKTYQL